MRNYSWSGTGKWGSFEIVVYECEQVVCKKAAVVYARVACAIVVCEISASQATRWRAGRDVRQSQGRELAGQCSGVCPARRISPQPLLSCSAGNWALAPSTHNRVIPHPRSKHTKVDVTKCHAWGAKWRWMSPSATSATQSAAASPAQARH